MIEKAGNALILPGVIFVLSLVVIYYGWRTGDRAAVFAAGLSWFYVVYSMSIIQSAIKYETESKTTKHRNYKSDIDKKSARSGKSDDGKDSDKDEVEFVT